MNNTIYLVIIIILSILVFIFGIFSSIASSQLNAEVQNLTEDSQDALLVSTENFNSLSVISGKTQNILADPNITNISGQMICSTEVTVQGNKIYESLEVLINDIADDIESQNPVILTTLTGDNISTTNLVYPYILSTSILLFPGYILDSEKGNPVNNPSYNLRKLFPVLGTLGHVVHNGGPIPDHGYVLNPNFKIIIFAKVHYEDFQGQFCNLTNEPLCFLMPPDYNKAERCRSYIVYYGTKLYNPFNSVGIPESRLTAEWTDNTFEPIYQYYDLPYISIL